MDMKKEYAKPSVSITEIDYAGMLCASDFFETTDTDEVDFGKGEWDGETIL